jgi:hypothetical protein
VDVDVHGGEALARLAGRFAVLDKGDDPALLRAEIVHAADTCWTSLKPASRASVSISIGVKKLMKGVPLARAPFSAS